MTTPTPPSNQEKKSSAILDAAQHHFATLGFEATKLSDVAKDAGVAVGTIYLRYEGKAELLAGVLNRVEERFCQAMDHPDIWLHPFPARFAHVVAAILQTAQNQSDLPRLMALSSYAPQNAGETFNTASDKRSILTGIEAHLRDGISRRELRDDVDVPLAARMAHGMVEGAMRALMTDPDQTVENIVQHISDASWSWLKPN